MLLDEAAGLRKNVDQPVMAGQVQQGTAQVASWNHKGVRCHDNRDGVPKDLHAQLQL